MIMEGKFVLRIGTAKIVPNFATKLQLINDVMNMGKQFAIEIGTVQIARNFVTQRQILITVLMMVNLSVCPTGMVKCVLYIARKTQESKGVKITARKHAHVIGTAKIVPCFVTQVR